MIKAPDVTLLYVMFAFIVSYAVLKKFLFRPLGAILEQREEEELAAARIHDESLRELERAVAEGEARLALARREALKDREALRGQGLARFEQLLDQAREKASNVLETSVEDIEYRDGEFRIAGTDRRIGLFELGALEATHTRAPEHYTYPNGCHICELEVDPQTGAATIVRYTVVDDFGRAMNPKLLEGQVQGGTVQGIGQALLEHAVYDPESGQLLSGSFMDYAMPRAGDLPSFDCGFHHVPCTTNPLGVKGAGEAGAVGAPAAVVNALANALGVRHLDMPLTPEKVWRALTTAQRS